MSFLAQLCASSDVHLLVSVVGMLWALQCLIGGPGTCPPSFLAPPGCYSIQVAGCNCQCLYWVLGCWSISGWFPSLLSQTTLVPPPRSSHCLNLCCGHVGHSLQDLQSDAVTLTLSPPLIPAGGCLMKRRAVRKSSQGSSCVIQR